MKSCCSHQESREALAAKTSEQRNFCNDVAKRCKFCFLQGARVVVLVGFFPLYHATPLLEQPALQYSSCPACRHTWLSSQIMSALMCNVSYVMYYKQKTHQKHGNGKSELTQKVLAHCIVADS